VTTSMGMDRTTAIIILGAIFIVFTALGGMESVAWTDTFCSVVILIGVWLLSYKAVNSAGGVVKIHQQLAQIKPSALDPFADGAIPFGVAMSWFLTWGIGNFGAPQFCTRIYSAKDPETAAMSQAWTGITFILFYLPLMLAALAGIVLFPNLTGPSDTIAPTIIKKLMGSWTGGILMAGILAASISTADSVLLLAGTTFVRDIVQRCSSRQYTSQETLRMARIATVVIGILAIFFTLHTNTGVMWIQANAVGFMGSMLSVVVLAAFAWKRANSTGALAAMIVGLITAAVWTYLDKPFGWFPILPSLVTCTLTLIVVSKMTKAPSEEVIKRFFPEDAK
jgi:SSS family transporter